MPPSPSFSRRLKRPAKTRSTASGGPGNVAASEPRSRRPAVRPSAASRHSRRRRKAASPAQAASRKACRSADVSFRKAAAKRDSSFMVPALYRVCGTRQSLPGGGFKCVTVCLVDWLNFVPRLLLEPLHHPRPSIDFVSVRLRPRLAVFAAQIGRALFQRFHQLLRGFTIRFHVCLGDVDTFTSRTPLHHLHHRRPLFDLL